MSETLRRLNFAPLLVVMVCLALATAVWAQSTMDGGIGGTVSDPTKAVITNATVTVRNQETNETSSGTTDSAGGFRIAHLRPGLYELTVNAAGFTPFKANRIVVEVGRITPLEIRLAVGATEQLVEVSGEAPVINTVQPDFTNNIDTTSLHDLPINARRYSSFAMSTPGAAPDGTYGLISYRGISGLLNSNTVDGGDNNTAFWSEERGRTRATATISQDSVREYQVNASNFSAEYGRAAGGVVNAVTKSGTNRLHGGGRLFVTDSEMWATIPSFTSTAPSKPPDRRYQFGGNLGGPIKKDKLFFFFNWDQQKETAPGVAALPYDPTITVSNPATATPAKTCSSTSLNAGQTLFCRGVSQATTNQAIAFLQGLTGTVNRNKDHWIIFPKVDWIITPRQTLTLSWNHMRWNSLGGIQTAGVVFNGTNSWGDDFVDVDTGNARLVSLLSNKVTNEFRLSIGREWQRQNSQAPGPGEPTTGLNGKPPAITIPGPTGGSYFAIGKPAYLERGALPLENRKQFADSMTAALGNHTLKFGFDFDHTNDFVSNLYQESGAYSYTNLPDFISDWAGFTGANATKLCSGGAAQCYRSFQQGVGPTSFEYGTNDYSAFLQDEWHGIRRLTVSLGVRWDYEQLPDPIWPNSKIAQTSSVPHDHFDIGPRLGFAYDLTGDGKTVVRGGWGLFYGRIGNKYISNILTGTGSPQSQLTTQSFTPSTTGAPLFPNILTAAAASSSATNVNVYGIIKAPMIHEADLVIEREIARNTVVSFSYLMSVGRRLPEVFDRNLNPTTATITYKFNGGPLDGTTQTMPLFTGSRPMSTASALYSLEYVGKSRYDGQVLQINRRMTNGLQLSFSYTHARATDTNQFTATDSTSMPVLDPFQPQLDNGTSGFDIRHSVGFAAVYQPKVGGIAGKIVNGFTISPTFGIRSGAPYTAGISGNATWLTSTGTYTDSKTGAPAAAFKPTTSGLNGANGAGRLYTTARNQFRYPTGAGANLRVARQFRVTEGKKIEFIAECFNLTNHVNITGISGTWYTVSSTQAYGQLPAMNYSSSFGTNTSANNQDRIGSTARQFQFGARFEF